MVDRVVRIHERGASSHSERDADIVARFRRGDTAQAVAAHCGLTYQRVLQILHREGVTAEDGGAALRRRRRVAEEERARDERYHEKYGCTYKQYRSLDRDVTRAFRMARWLALAAGVEFSLKLWEWWGVWRDSGLWDERGRSGARMERVDKTRGFVTGNVTIRMVRGGGQS